MASLDFSRRADLSELMDTEECGFEEFRACLRDLERVNRLTFTYRPVIAFLDGLADEGRLPRGRPLTVVDAGSGYGGLLRRIDQWAARRGISVHLVGVDLNPWSAKAASEATPAGSAITFVTADLFAHRPEGGVDLIVSSQFTHHLSDDALAEFLRWMERTAQIGWFVADLHRHKLPYHVFRFWAGLAGWHRFVRHDGPVSIARAFRSRDWRAFLAEAGIPEAAAEIRWHIPFRLCVSRVKA